MNFRQKTLRNGNCSMFHNIQGDLASRISVDKIVHFRSLIGKSTHYIDSTIMKEASLGKWPIVVEESPNSFKSLVLPLFLLYVSLICVNKVVKKKL
jgi:hypothetical protein